MTRALAVLLLLSCCCTAYAQDNPSGPLPDPLAVDSTVQGWAMQQSTWTRGGERKDMTGARVWALLGHKRFGFGVRAETLGIPGEYNQQRPETFRVAAAYLGLHYNLVTPGYGVSCGVTALVGTALSLETRDGEVPTTPHGATGGVGVRCSGQRWWGYMAVGGHQSLEGAAVVGTFHVGLSDRVAVEGDVGIGAGSRYLLSVDFAVRAF